MLKLFCCISKLAFAARQASAGTRPRRHFLRLGTSAGRTPAIFTTKPRKPSSQDLNLITSTFKSLFTFISFCTMQFRLHNAHRIVRFKTGVEPKYLQLPDGSRSPIPINWRQTVTNDVVKFIDDKRVPLAKLPSILQNPARYFCRSHNVPLESRKQIFL